MDKNKLVAIIGPTASGKTKVAVDLAFKINTEIISGDSRQVYKGMDLGTGKDIDEYSGHGIKIPYHLIDIVPAGYKYNIHEFQEDFFSAYQTILNKNKLPGESFLHKQLLTLDKLEATGMIDERILYSFIKDVNSKDFNKIIYRGPIILLVHKIMQNRYDKE